MVLAGFFDVITFRYGRCFGQPTDEAGTILTECVQAKAIRQM